MLNVCSAAAPPNPQTAPRAREAEAVGQIHSPQPRSCLLSLVVCPAPSLLAGCVNPHRSPHQQESGLSEGFIITITLHFCAFWPVALIQMATENINAVGYRLTGSKIDEDKHDYSKID